MIFQRVQVIAQVSDGLDTTTIARQFAEMVQHSSIEWTMSFAEDADACSEHAQYAVGSGVDLVVAYGDVKHITDVAVGLYLSNIPFLICFPEVTNADQPYPENLCSSLRDSVHTICSGSGQIVWMDMARVDERYFLHQLQVAHSDSGKKKDMLVSHGSKGGTTQASLLQSAVPASMVKFTVIVDDEEHFTEGTTISIVNVACNANLPPSLQQDIRFDDGKIDVIILNDHVYPPHVCTHAQGKRVVIQADKTVEVSADNGVYNTTRLMVEVIPKAVSIFVPGLHH